MHSQARLEKLIRSGLFSNESEERFDRLTRRAQQETGAAASALSLVGQDRCFFKSLSGVPEGSIDRSAPAADCLCAVVAQLGEIVVADDARLDPLLRDSGAVTRFGTVAYLGVPLRASDGECFGALSVTDGQARLWTDADVALLKDLAAQASTEVGLSLAQIDKDLASERAQRLESVALALSTTSSVAEAASASVEALASALSAQAGVLAVAAPDDPLHLEIVAQLAVSPSVLAPYRRLSLAQQLPAVDAFRSGQPVIIDSLAALLAQYPHLDGAVDPRYQAWVSVPLLVDGRATGVAWFLFTAPRTFVGRDESLMMAIGRQAGQAIARARLFEAERAAREHAEALFARMNTLERVAEALSGALDVHRISTTVVEGGASALGAQTAGLWTPSADGSELVRLHAHGIAAALEARTRRLSISGPTPLAAAFRDGRNVWIRSAAEYAARFPESFAGVSALRPDLTEVAMACLPLIVDGHAMGVLSFGFESARGFDENEQTFVALLAQPCAQAMERARLFAEQQRLAHERAQLLESERRARLTAEEALARAHESERHKDEFLAMLSHELRNPLAPIVTAMALLGRRPDPPRRELEVIGRQVQHLTRLVDDLLDVSRITRGKIELRRATVELGEVVANAIEQTSPLFEQKEQRLTVDVPATGLPVHGDAGRLSQVMANLLTNAAKYTERRGNIQIVGAAEGDQVMVSVKDDGIGIPAQLLPHIFDLFVQAPQALDRSRGGLGLGLTIVKRLVEMHDGVITVRSDPVSRGTTVTVRLPRAVLATPPPRPASSPTEAVVRERRRVLVVDDNEDAAEMLAESLRLEGFIVEVAHDGPNGIELASAFSPEVVLLDIGLPVMDGYEVARHLRRATALSPVRLVAITGYGQAQERQRALGAGFDAHLVKPVDLAAVLAAIDGRNDSSPGRVGDLQL